ncbi:hypothetical protein ISN44_As06g011030 [Arabidopsis suecica]|uniref:Uncharacterized protein n=1 Tax=Arabidopsis suecica TaxID=45249 RepID=A0A8T2CES3_ARASU|nr:hypothetical protein ISN44_As06g011030 [Arabidopsis suecica]
MKYLQEEGSKSDEEDRKSSLEAMEKTNVDLELWKESFENLFNNVLMTTTRKRGEKFASKGRNKRGDKSQKKAKKWCDICTCDDHIEGAEFSSVAKVADEDVKRFSRTRRRKDVVVIKRGHHKRMLTSEKNGAQEDAYLGKKWSISRLKSKPKTT